MSNIKDFAQKLKQYLIARIPFIYINSIERNRVLNTLQDINKKLHLPVYLHTLSKGMYDLTNKNIVNEDKSLPGALEYISQQIMQRQNLTFIFSEVTDIEDDTITARHFLDLITLAESRGGVIIVLSDKPVWKRLQRLGMSLILDLPEEDEIIEIIKDSIYPYKNNITLEWDESDYKKAANAFVGLSKIEIQNIIATLIAKKK